MCKYRFPKGTFHHYAFRYHSRQYFPGKSILHKLDPRVKIVSIILFIVTIFLSKTYAGFALVFAVSALLVAVSHIRFSTILKSLKPVLFILIFTMIANLLWTSGDHPFGRILGHPHLCRGRLLCLAHGLAHYLLNRGDLCSFDLYHLAGGTH